VHAISFRVVAQAWEFDKADDPIDFGFVLDLIIDTSFSDGKPQSRKK
jgi:hypothetical protein